MTPIINFTEKKGGANNSSPEGKTSVISLSSKTLQLAIKCSRSENIDVYTSNAQSIIDGTYAGHLESNFADYIWHADKVRNFSLSALYISKILNGLDEITAKQVVIASALDIPDTYPRRLVHYTVNGAKQQSTIYEMLAYARKNEILFSYESLNKHCAECFLMVTTKDRIEDLNTYFSNPDRTFKAVFITSPKSNILKVLVVMPYVCRTNEYYSLASQFSANFKCRFDVCLSIENNEKIIVPNYSRIGDVA